MLATFSRAAVVPFLEDAAHAVEPDAIWVVLVFVIFTATRGNGLVRAERLPLVPDAVFIAEWVEDGVQVKQSCLTRYCRKIWLWKWYF